MKSMLTTACFATGAALILLTGCVSSKKYKASQADVAKLKSDSTQLAQQVSSLNTNVTDLQSKNTTLQGSLDKSNASYAAQQEHLNYYQNYFKDQQTAMNQVSDDLKGALTQAGIANADVEQVNNTVYVRLDEGELFKKNTNMVTPGGKKALDNLALVIGNRQNVNVYVAADDSAVAGMNTIDTSMAMAAPKPVHHRHVMHHTATTGGTGSGTASATGTAATPATASTAAAPAPKKVHHHYNAEGSMAFNNGPGHHNRSWATKEGHMVTIANHFLKSGVPKLNVRLQQPPADGTEPSKTIRVIFTPKMDNFTPPQSNSSASAK